MNNMSINSKEKLIKRSVVGWNYKKLSHYIKPDDSSLCGLVSPGEKLRKRSPFLCKRCERIYNARKIFFYVSDD